jgi:MFS family permease
MLVRVAAPPDAVRAAAIRALHLDPRDRALVGPAPGATDPDALLTVGCSAVGGATNLELGLSSGLQVPYFGWFVRLISWVSAPRLLRHAADLVEADLGGTTPPGPPKQLPLLPPVSFTGEQAARLGAIAAVAVIANFGGALLTQNGDAVTRSFDQSNDTLGFALALVRAGVLVSLVATAMSDRFGRRRMILVCLVGICVANGVTAMAPSFEVFTAGQFVTRALVNATLIVAAVAAVEEAPEGARAYAFALFALALGLGFGATVVLLPLADLGDDGWRIAFAVSALSAVLLPGIGRNLRETKRFRRLTRTSARGRLREVFDRRYGFRFALLGVLAFLVNVFSAPSSQLTNRYLTDTHDYSNSEVALFRGVTAGVPGIIGIVIAGRLAETRGRRPVTIIGLIVASLFQVAFFLGDGALLWLMPSVAIVAAACAGLAVGTMDAEFFPTEVRGTSNGFLLVCGVAGSALGFFLATQLDDLVGGLGPAIALCAIAPLVAAVFVVPRLPETRARTLDDISPSEI